MKKTYFIILIISITFLQGKAQGITFFGNTYIDSGGTVYVNNFPVNFEGMMYTSTSTSYPGILALSENTVWQRNNNAFVDGAIKSYHVNEFEFPVGNETVFAPILISSDSEVTANYQFDSADSTNEFSDDLDAVSTLEYWNVLGNADGLLTLTWRNISDLGSLTNNDLENLRIAGWNSMTNQWEVIPHQTLTGDINAGSMVSQDFVDFNLYTAFTFGMKDKALGIDDLLLPNVQLYLKEGFLNATSANFDMLKISFFDMAGRLVINYVNINDVQFRDAFPYPKGIYVARIALGNGQTIHKKVINQ